jgi:hypothetical protein
MAEGKRFSDVRLAFVMLVDGGRLVEHRGFVRRPTGARRSSRG